MSGDTSTQVHGGGGGPAGPVRRVLIVMLDDAVTSFPLGDSGEVVVGRGHDAGVRVDHPSVSRRHLAIELGPMLRVRDLDSANGTSLRGARLPAGRAIELAANETFAAGDVALVVQERSLAPRRVPPARSAPLMAPVPGAAIPPVLIDPAMLNLFDLARRVAVGTINVLITGESGAGKELLAEAVHRASPRARGPMVRVNCAAVAEGLLESELFGHDRGAFTGAAAARVGVIEAAHGGTLFLDEVGELSAAAQSKLLRVLEDRRVMRVGSTEARAVDVRFVAATNRDLEADSAAGRFRSDLYFRLAGIVLEVPPLRQRPAELEPLARAFAASVAAALGRSPPTFTADAIAALHAHDWPGNVRELRNAVERAVLLAGDKITAADLRPTGKGARPGAATAADPPADDERARIVAALEHCAGNQTRAAKHLGMPLRTLVKRLDEYDIPRPKRG